MWRNPNLIDDRFAGISGHGDRFESCVEEALNSDLYGSISPLDIAEIRYICRESIFRTVSESRLSLLLFYYLLLLCFSEGIRQYGCKVTTIN